MSSVFLRDGRENGKDVGSEYVGRGRRRQFSKHIVEQRLVSKKKKDEKKRLFSEVVDSALQVVGLVS